MATPTAATFQSYRLARRWHVAVAVLIAAALVTQFVLSLAGIGAADPDLSASTRVIRFISFFTILSNILLCAMSVTLAIRPGRRDGFVWRVLRLDALLCMTVTGLVFVTVLRGLEELEGLRIATDAVFHYIGPVLAVAGWLLFGPRPRITLRVVFVAVIPPILWAVYTLTRGAIVDHYPYPFIDLNEHGYGQVLVNILAVAALLIALGLLFWYLDRRLPAAPVGGPAPSHGE